MLKTHLKNVQKAKSTADAALSGFSQAREQLRYANEILDDTIKIANDEIAMLQKAIADAEAEKAHNINVISKLGELS